MSLLGGWSSCLSLCASSLCSNLGKSQHLECYAFITWTNGTTYTCYSLIMTCTKLSIRNNMLINWAFSVVEVVAYFNWCQWAVFEHMWKLKFWTLIFNVNYFLLEFWPNTIFQPYIYPPLALYRNPLILVISRILFTEKDLK